jgi:hypothetical protein
MDFKNMTAGELLFTLVLIVVLRTGFIFLIWNFVLAGGFIPEITALQAFALTLLLPGK